MTLNKGKLKIGNLQLDNPFFLAPLAGISDAPTRRICRKMGAALTYSEMVSGKGLWYASKNTNRLLTIYDDEKPVGYQIFGADPEIIAFTAKQLDTLENALLDINMGCPVPKVVKNGEGSALMKNPELVYKIVEAAVKNTTKPVTAKIRIGWDENQMNCVEIARAIEAAGGAAVTVHGRTREQYYTGKADWAYIAKVKAAVNIPVIGNGDIVDSKSAIAMMNETGCDFVMVGRKTLGNPWIFRELVAAWEGSLPPEPPTLEEKKQIMEEHFMDMLELKGDYAAVREMRKHIGWYMKGVKGSAKIRDEINKITSAEELILAINKIKC